MAITEKPLHPAAAIFPALSGSDLDALTEDIRVNGLIEPITLHPDGSILDGRNREAACIRARVEARYTEWTGYGKGSPESFVLSKNLHRRHLNTSQRAMVAAKLVNMPSHRPSGKGAISPPYSRSQAAQALNVGESVVKHARKVLESGQPEMVAGIEAGTIPVETAFKKLPADPAKKKPRNEDGEAKRHRNTRIWKQLRDGLETLNGLPDPKMTSALVPNKGREKVSRLLPTVLAWLIAFDAEWKIRGENHDGTNTQTPQATALHPQEDHLDARGGAEASGAQ